MNCAASVLVEDVKWGYAVGPRSQIQKISGPKHYSYKLLLDHFRNLSRPAIFSKISATSLGLVIIGSCPVSS